MRYLLAIAVSGCVGTSAVVRPEVDAAPTQPREEHVSQYAESGRMPGSMVAKTLLGASVDLRAAATSIPGGTNFGGCTFSSGAITCLGMTITSTTAAGITFTDTNSVQRITWGSTQFLQGSASNGRTYSSGGYNAPSYGLGNGASTSQLFATFTAPTISAAGTSPSVLSNNGSAAFRVDVGTGGTATGFTMTFPAATTRWVCSCRNITTNTTTTEIVQTAYTSTTCVMEQRTRATNAALAFGAGDDAQCTAVGE